MHDVACEFAHVVMRSKDVQKQLAQTSLSGRHGGLVASELDSGAGSPGSSPGRGHCVVFLGKTLHSHDANLMLGG